MTSTIHSLCANDPHGEVTTSHNPKRFFETSFSSEFYLKVPDFVLKVILRVDVLVIPMELW